MTFPEKKYNVYAIGNALVDMEFAVDDAFLTQQNIDKGVMTLVDTDQQQALYDALAGHTGKMASGGSAANTIIAVSHFGGKSFYSCKVANDPAGDFYVQDLVAAGVDTNLHKEREPGVSGKCTVAEIVRNSGAEMRKKRVTMRSVISSYLAPPMP